MGDFVTPQPGITELTPSPVILEPLPEVVGNVAPSVIE